MIAAIIQARMNSSRLPGKVLMKIRNRPMLDYLLHQLNYSKKLSKLIIATTTNPKDDIISNYAKNNNLDFFRGKEDDVLDRFYQCAKFYDIDKIVRITSDCPLIDPKIIDKSIEKFETGKYDYLSNAHKKVGNKWEYNLCGFPLGFSVEIFSFYALEKSWSTAKKMSEREHVTLNIINNPDFYKIGSFKNSQNLSKLRLAIDHQIDFDLIKIIIENFPDDEVFSLSSVSKFLDKNPKLKKMNSGISFDEGYKKSLMNDKIIF